MITSHELSEAEGGTGHRYQGVSFPSGREKFKGKAKEDEIGY